MSPDDRVDLIKHISAERRERILPGLAQAEQEDIRRLSAYPEGTVGAVMTSEYALLQPELTVVEALDKLRSEAPDKETIYYAYAVAADLFQHRQMASRYLGCAGEYDLKTA